MVRARTGGDPDPDRWARIEALCFEAMSLPGEERPGFLERRCQGDRDLRDRVEALLAALDRAPDFLETPLLSLPADPGEDGADDPRSPFPAGEVTVGRYRLIRPLGHGGMGDVHLASYEGDGFTRTVAVKLIRRGLDTERVLERFREERRILAGLRHPHIAQLLDGGATEDGRPYFVMEFVEGEPVDDHCDRRDLPVRERVALVETLCDAVHHAHQNLVVHRDIKPANVLVTPEGRPKLLDFGIGKVLSPDEADPETTRVEERALTPAYAAPELLRGEPITTAADVFGLGVLLYRLLTGVLPWPVEGSRGERLAALQSPPRRPGAVAPPGRKVGRDLDAIVLKALAEEPERRYGSAAALAEDLRRYLDGRPVRARAPGFLYSARKFVGRHRVSVAAAGVAFLSLVWGGAYTLQQSRRVAAERDKALEVRGFLLESFGAAGADRATGDSVTARALLDAQADAVTEAYAEQPDLQAEMMVVLAEGYERLGLFAEAREWAERGLELRRGSPPGEQAAGLGLLGWITHQQGRPDEALPILEEAVAGARADRGAGRTLARTLNDLGVVQEALGDFEAAGESHREAMELRVGLFGEGHRSVAVSASNLSVIRYRQGDFQGAVEEASRALRAVRSSFGPDHQRAIIVQSNLAVFKLVAGDLQGAEDDFRDLWERQARIQGPDHPVTVRVMNSLATVLRQREKWMEAESVLREVLRIMEGWEDPNPTDLATTLANLGDVVSVRGDFADGEALIRRALDLQLGILGPDHLEVANSQVYLSNLFERAGDLDDAIAWRREAAGTLERTLGPEREAPLTQQLELARLLRAAGRGEEAREVLESVRARAEAGLAPDHPLLGQARRALAELGG